MTFQPAIPLSSDLISVSQVDIKNNFTSLSTAFDTNHIDFNATGAGKHKFAVFPEQSSGPATIADEVALYSKAISAVSELFLRKESSGTEIQMSVGSPTIASPGSTFLPGGIVLKWGNTGSVSNGSTVTFISSFPTTCWGVVLTTIDPGASTKIINVRTGSVSTTQFLVNLSSGSLSAFYIAIGN